MIQKIYLLIVVAMLVSCSPSEATIQTALAETLAANPTSTVAPSATFTTTPTFTSTPTFTPTLKPTNTRTPTSTPTATHLPVTQTKIAKDFRSTQTARAATATAHDKAATATEIASYIEINTKELITYPDAHTGEKIKVKGKIFNINSDSELQMWVGGRLDAVYVIFTQPFSGIYEDDRITVYGTVLGENCGTNSFGTKICQPLIDADFYTKP